MATRSTPPAAASAPSYLGPFITVTVLFGIFGFLTSLNNQLVPKLEDDLSTSLYGPAMLATAAWFFAYLVFSVPSAKLIEGGLQAHHGDLAFHHGGGRAVVYPRGQAW